jgi:hypothetical protein
VAAAAVAGAAAVEADAFVDLTLPADLLSYIRAHSASPAREEQLNGDGNAISAVSVPAPAPVPVSECGRWWGWDWDSPVLSLEAMLVEVKGPTDSLSERQTVWLNLLRKDIPSYVCRVSEKEVGKEQEKEKEKKKKKTDKNG